MYKYFIKYIFDFLIAMTGMIILSPVYLILTLLLFISNKRAGVFFTQQRPGKNARIFKIYKYKTMTDERGADGKLLPDAKRLTKVGHFIRSTSLDELPQLFNVLKGDMSLIGPRPLLPKYLPMYNERQARRHEVRPGITGWTQVNGRNSISWDQKFELDVWYVENLSFLLDMRILWMTILKVIKREGISQQGEATMESFKGNIS